MDLDPAVDERALSLNETREMVGVLVSCDHHIDLAARGLDQVVHDFEEPIGTFVLPGVNSAIEEKIEWSSGVLLGERNKEAIPQSLPIHPDGEAAVVRTERRVGLRRAAVRVARLFSHYQSPEEVSRWRRASGSAPRPSWA